MICLADDGQNLGKEKKFERFRKISIKKLTDHIITMDASNPSG